MRSVFVENLDIYIPDNSENIFLKAKEYHHLINVIRLKTNEKILLFDKEKNIFNVQVVQIDKKGIELKTLKKKKALERTLNLSVALGKLKKDALDLSIKQLVEIGCQEIIIFQSSFSQSYKLKPERVDKIIISAMEQSNNFIFPTIIEKDLAEVLKTDKNIIYFTSVSTDHQKIDTFASDSLIIIGPEGGLSEREEQSISERCKSMIHLPTPILRAQTAVSFCLGYYVGIISK
jgi:16S rRNA (uracil1498-N3)-methyltransferase